MVDTLPGLVEVTTKPAALATLKTDLLGATLFEGKGLQGIVKELDRQLAGFISEILAKEGMKGKKGEVKLIHLPRGRDGSGAACLFLVGLGPESDFHPDLARRAAGVTLRQAAKIRAKKVSLAVSRQTLLAATEGALLGAYNFDLYKTEKKEEKRPVEELEILVPGLKDLKGAKEKVRTAVVGAEATNLARTLINTPASDMTPRRMAEEAKKIGRLPGLSVRVYEKKEIEKFGMNSFLAVAKGSSEPPCLIHLTYRPARKPNQKPKKKVAIVGKGITFDSGGLSLKTAQSMETMKDDMSGAAAVLGLFQALAALKPPVEVHGIAAVTENMPSGGADKPGDVVRAMNGKTIEILNTDAEGRLTLADAIPFALRQRPDLVIDVATLTGACVVALGELCAGIMGNNQPLIDRLVTAGASAGERIWQLPLIEEYKEELKSPVADLKNVGGRYGGTINGALFIQEFADPKVPWAHIDIAGPSWTEKELDTCPKGGTGFITRTLLQFLLNL